MNQHSRLMFVFLVVASLCVWLAPNNGRAQSVSADAVRTDEKPLQAARLESLSFDGKQANSIGFKTEKGKLLASLLDKLVRWGHPRQAGEPFVLLADGGELPVEETLSPIHIEAEQLRFDSTLFGELQLPLELVRGVALKLPSGPAERQLLLQQLRRQSDKSRQVTTDRLLLANGDVLAGTIVAWEEGTIHISAAGRTSEIEVAQVAAVSFNPALSRAPDADQSRVAVGFSDGSLLMATRLSDEGNLRVKVATFGDRIYVTPRDKVVYLQPLGFSVQYLSDLSASSYKHVPFLSLTWEYRRDANVGRGPLLADGKLYRKGLGMHSPARLTYRLDGKYRKFQAEAAIDDSTEQRGSVICRVFIDDGSGSWKSVFTSPLIRGGQPPLPIEVDLTGAKQISLLVDYADRGDQLDHLNWLDARLLQ